MDTVDLRNATVGALVVTVSLGVVSDLLFVGALQARPAWFADPAQLVAGGETSAQLLTWAAVADLCGYYLPTIVVAVALWTWLGDRQRALSTGGLVGALGYAVAGSVAASALAIAGPSLIRAYTAAGADQPAIVVTLGFLVDVAVRAIWQLLDGFFIAGWLVATGLLVRDEQPAFARLSIGLGALFVLSAVANVAGFGLARDVILAVIFALWFAWDVWLATLVWRRRAPFRDPA